METPPLTPLQRYGLTICYLCQALAVACALAALVLGGIGIVSALKAQDVVGTVRLVIVIPLMAGVGATAFWFFGVIRRSVVASGAEG